MKTLRRGDKGSEVTYAQQRLMAKGYELPKYGADGDFGGRPTSRWSEFRSPTL